MSNGIMKIGKTEWVRVCNAKSSETMGDIAKSIYEIFVANFGKESAKELMLDLSCACDSDFEGVDA